MHDRIALVLVSVLFPRWMRDLLGVFHAPLRTATPTPPATGKTGELSGVGDPVRPTASLFEGGSAAQ